MKNKIDIIDTYVDNFSITALKSGFILYAVSFK